MRFRRAIFVSVLALVGGCGDDDSSSEEQAAQSPTAAITIQAPSDGDVLRSDTVVVRGTVEPADSRVTVDSRPARVVDGEFSREISLVEGTNTITIYSYPRDKTVLGDTERMTVTRELTAEERAQKKKEEAEVLEARAHRVVEEDREFRQQQAADNFPAWYRRAFMSACTIEGEKRQCGCALERIEARFSLDQAMIIDQTYLSNGQLPPSYLRQFRACEYAY